MTFRGPAPQSLPRPSTAVLLRRRVDGVDRGSHRDHAAERHLPAAHLPRPSTKDLRDADEAALMERHFTPKELVRFEDDPSAENGPAIEAHVRSCQPCRE